MAEKTEKTDLHALHHSMAHILATAVQELFPDVKFGVGPVIENGFYYDFDLPEAITADDLGRIEAKMREVVKADYSFERQELPIEEATNYFEQRQQPYKVELLRDLKTHGTTVAKDIDREQLGVEDVAKVTTVTLYASGPFTDLCRGGHLERTGQAGAFKLTKVSGAYWRGQADNPQMQRVYGVAFETKAELDKYMQQVEEAEKRDHRKLGRELDLFTFSDLVGAGLPLYTPRGTVLIDALKGALRQIGRKHDMLPVSIPHLAKLELYKLSGHAEKFEAELFRVKSHYNQEFILKPVNCPHHTQIYAAKPRSYRDLPLRYVEQTMQYRDEKPGQIGGLQRTRGFTVDDGHIFCRVDQIEQEAGTLVEIITEFYQALGLWDDHWVSLSLRDPSTPDAYIGEASDWDAAEQMLAEVCKKHNLEAKPMEGEAALYGPKIDFMFKDALGRQTQLATVQLDFAMPKRFGLTYQDKDGTEKPPVMIHRAILGSFERFIMLLIEHYAGNFPLWLAPEQVRLATVNDDEAVLARAREMRTVLKDADIRVELDDSAESVGKKIRAASLAKVPYTIVVGEKEAAGTEVSPRIRSDLGQSEPKLPFDKFAAKIKLEVADRAARSSL
ncbi:MAG TPA: threonine--tRNA ligase [Candidatus Saccharimonadales bacterium]|nr:threonine--tRNA ligase [Candidatus Saccharimonadales bacterium]